MTDTIATQSVVIEADIRSLDRALAEAQRDLQTFERRFGQTRLEMPTVKGVSGDPFAPLTRSAGTARDGVLALAQANARLAVAQGDPARGADILSQALSRVTVSSTQTIGAQTQLANLQNRIAREAQAASGGVRTFGGAIGQLGGALGAVGLGLGAAQLVQFGASAIQAANSLERTQATLRAVAGDQATYSRVLEIAAANQRLLGGSLQENLGPLQQFLFISNRTGASLEELNKVAQLLATVNPTEGIAGAGFALSEAFSGDLTSIVERFNLPRQAVRELLNEAQGADEVLAGVTELLAAQGVTAETLSASLNTNAQAYTALGAEASTAFTNIGAAASAAFAPVATFIAGGLAGFNQLVDAGNQAAAAAQAVFADSGGDYDAYRERLAAINAELVQIGQSQEPLTQAQYTYAQALIASGVAAGEAAAQAAAYGEQTVILDDGTSQVIESATALADAQALLAENIRLAGATAADQAVEQANAAASMDLAAVAAQAEEQALQAATQAAFEQANAGANLEAQARAAAQALLEAGGAGQAAAARLAGSSSQVDVLTAAYYRLIAAQQAAGAGSGAVGNLGARVTKGAGQATAAIRELNRVYNAGPLAPRPTGGGGGARRRSGGGGGGGKSEAEKAAEQEVKAAQDRAERIATIEERFREASLAAEERFREDYLSIIERFNESVLDAQRDLQAESAGSRADFYDSLTSSDLPQDVQQNLAGAYEAAFAEAQRLSQEGKAELAADYLALKQDQIAAEQKFQEARAKAAAEGDQAEVARLEAIKRLRDAEFQARESNLFAEGDANVEQRDQALADAEQRRQEALATAAATAGDAASAAEAKTREQVGLTNEAYQERLRLLQQLGGIPGGAGTVPGGSAASPAPAAPVSTTPTAAASASGATVVSAPDVVAQIQSATAELSKAVRAVERAVGRIGRAGLTGGGG